MNPSTVQKDLFLRNKWEDEAEETNTLVLLVLSCDGATTLSLFVKACMNVASDRAPLF